MKNLLSLIVLVSFTLIATGQKSSNHDLSPREHILFDFNWKFALGHACDAGQDFNNGTGYFSYFAKTGYGDGAAAAGFDDRAWRILDLPHDWYVETDFVPDGSHSHGYKAVGRNYPGNSVGWYRKAFFIPEEDLGKKISIEFEGVFRNSIVWVNGFYLGTEPSGYTGFEYDITDYLNYGGENVIAVRADATMEEGWYYEGAGIYRHVYLNKVHPLHVDRHGTYVTTTISEGKARISVQTTVRNSSGEQQQFRINQSIVNDEGMVLGEIRHTNQNLSPISTGDFHGWAWIEDPRLWTPDSPTLHYLITEIVVDDEVVDRHKTTFGIRTVHFDANKGFFLNGEHIKLVGVNNHKDHAGVGTAIPDALIEWRIRKMQEMGVNAIRTAHDPPAPAFLEACDRLGMMVMAENRLTGSNTYHFDLLERFMKRDRNHPSIVLWSLGNEEWAIEGNVKGIRITETMQDFANTIDSTRAFTLASSGGWDQGIGTVSEVIGYNYIVHGDIDAHHEKFPWQPSIGTEETNTRGTRGIYKTDEVKCHLEPTNTDPEKPGAEYGWNFYNDREFLSGIFYWTGFDYRGEPTPFAWPAVTSQFGIVDLCGFPKDIYYYFQSWWQDEPLVHIWPHWNWPGDEGQEKQVTVYSNCAEAELFQDGKSLGKKQMPENGHLTWQVVYKPGELLALGYSGGKETARAKSETTGQAKKLVVTADRKKLTADNRDVSVITVQVNDNKDRMVPTANIELQFTLEGPGKIIGVGNGDPSSHEPERFFETITTIGIESLKELPVDNLDNRPEVKPNVDAASWKKAFDDGDRPWNVYEDTLLVVRGSFELTSISDEMVINLFTKSIVENQSIYVNGHLIDANIPRDDPDQSYELDHSILVEGENTYAVTGQRFRKTHQWDEPNTDPGLVQVIEPVEQWRRKTFNGLAQVIVQTTDDPGEIQLNVHAEGMSDAGISLISE